MIVTNGTVSKRFDEFASFPKELKKHLFFKFSYNYLEFKKRGLFDVFFNNIRKVRDAGCSFTLELTPSDDAIPYIDAIKQLAIKELGAANHVTIARDEKDDNELPMMTSLPRDKYLRTWGVFRSALFDYKPKIFGQKRTDFCYAGDWSFYLNLATGEMTQCYQSYFKANIFDDLSKPVLSRLLEITVKNIIATTDIPLLFSEIYRRKMRRHTLNFGIEYAKTAQNGYNQK